MQHFCPVFDWLPVLILSAARFLPLVKPSIGQRSGVSLASSLTPKRKDKKNDHYS